MKRDEKGSNPLLDPKDRIIDNPLVPALAKTDKGCLAEQVTTFKQFVIHDFPEGYIGDSKKARNDVYSHLNNIIKQDYTLYQQNLAFKEQINLVESELKVMKEGCLLKEERALKRKNAISQKMRDSVNESEL